MGDRCKTEGRMDKMDLSQIVIKFVVIEHGLSNVCDNSTLMISTLTISTIKVPPSLMAKLQQLKLLPKIPETIPVSKIKNNV